MNYFNTLKFSVHKIIRFLKELVLIFKNADPGIDPVNIIQSETKYRIRVNS